MRVFLLSLFVLLIGGCGYMPAARVVDDIMPQTVFVDVVMSKTDPQNTVAIKDAVRSGIVKRLGKTLASKQNAQTYIIATINSLNFEKLTYDQFGYVTSYKANLNLNFKTKLNDGTIFSVNTVGDHDFRVTRLVKNVRDTSSVISDKDRYEAIENASRQAFDEFISALAIKGFKLDESKRVSEK